MKTIDSILTRRSIRQYTGEVISAEELETILKAAMYAPSAKKTLPWHFVVTQDPETLEKIMQVHHYIRFAKEAGTVILVCADKKINENEVHLIQDTSAAIQNMLLAAREMGLGTCWCGVRSNEEAEAGLREIFGIADPDILPMSLVAIGHPAVEPAVPERFMKDRIHVEKW
ncbi:MAG: nitroreductase family protein [Clostridia bacterium]|nr:nitroreductase family protein [Clostridia bacterium]MBQ7601032.1 nitroreductase family protein [Lachnospiraceae bacterium]MBR3195303.1 nitroreductase family protein [Clostridia bacterium]